MALRNCKECGHQVSTKADFCPNCGAKKPTSKKSRTFLAIIIAIGGFIIFGEFIDWVNSTTKPKGDKFAITGLAVREGPSTDYEIKKYLGAGEHVNVLYDSLGWDRVMMIEDENTLGWASAKYLNDISEYDTWKEEYDKEMAKKREQEEKQEAAERKREEANAWRTEDNSVTAYIMCEDWVKDRLKAPSTAEFQSIWNGRYDNTFKDGTKYQITSYVDAENSFGAKLRMGFTCETKQVSEDEWQLISLEIDN